MFQVQDHIIKGKLVEIKLAQSKAKTKVKLLEEKSRKIYVSEVDPSITKRKACDSISEVVEQITEYFRQFGAVEKVKLIDGSKNGKNYAFLLMENKSVIDLIMGDSEVTDRH